MKFKETLFEALKIIAIFSISAVAFFATLFIILYMAYLFCLSTSGSGICSI